MVVVATAVDGVRVAVTVPAVTVTVAVPVAVAIAAVADLLGDLLGDLEIRAEVSLVAYFSCSNELSA